MNGSEERRGTNQFEVESYLAHQGEKIAARFLSAVLHPLIRPWSFSILAKIV